MADEKDLYTVNENTGKTKNGLIIEYTGSNEQIKQSAGNQAAIKASKVMEDESKSPLPKFTLSDGKVSVTGGEDKLSHPVVTEMKKALSNAFKGKDLTDKDVAAAFQKAITKANEQIDAQFKYEDYEDFLKSSGFSDEAYRSYSTARQESKKTNPTSSTAMVKTYDKSGKPVSKSISEWFDYWKKEYSPEDRGQLWVKSLQASYNPTSDEDLYASIPAILMGAKKGQNVVQGFFQWINPFDDADGVESARTVTPVYGFDDTNPISVGIQSAVAEFGRILPQFLGAGNNPWLDRGAEDGGDFFGINDWKDEYLENWSREDFQEWAKLAHEAAENEGANTYEKMKELYGDTNGRKMWMAYTLSLKGQEGVGGGKVLDTIKEGDKVVAEAGDYVGYQNYRNLWRELNSQTPAKSWDQNLQNSIEKFATYAPNAASVGVVAGQVGRIIAEQAALSLISGGALSASNIAKTLTQGGWKLVGKATGIIKAGQEIAKTSPALARAIYGLAYGSSQGLTGASRILYRLGQAGTWAVREVGEDALRGIVDDAVTRNSFDSQGNLDPNKFLENVYMNAVMGAILKGPRTISDITMHLLNADRNIDGLKLNGTQVSQMQDLAQAASGTADSVIKSIDEDGHPTITKGGVDQKLDQVTLTKENADKVLPEQAPTKTLEEAVFEDESIAKKTQGAPGEVSIADEEVKEVISGQDPEAAKNLIERKLTDDEIRRKFKNGKVSINGEDYIIDVKNANLDDIVSANGSTIKDLNTGVARLVASVKQGLRSYQEAVNGIKSHADEFATNWKNAVEKFASDNNISVRDVIIALRDLRIDGTEPYPGLKALWEENWAPTANGLLDAQDSLTKIRTKRQNYYQRDMFAGVFKPGENGNYAIDQGTIDDILGRDTTFDLTASSRKGNRQKVNDADLETDPEILAKEFVLSRLETIERYSDQGKIIATMREAISDGEELTQKEAAESLRASKKIGNDIRNSEEVQAVGKTVTEQTPIDNVEELADGFGKEDMTKLDEDIKAQKKVVSDLEAEVTKAKELDDEIKSQRAQVARSQEEVDRLKAKETDPKAVSKLNYDARKELAEKVARNNQRADGYGSKYTVLYRVQDGKPDKWRPNNRNTGYPGEFKSYGGQWDGAVWLTADKDWAEGPERASAGVSSTWTGGKGANVTNDNIVVIPVKNEDILFLNHETGSKAALDESGKKIVKTRGVNNGMKRSEFILWENEHPEIFEDGHKAMLEELNKQREFENKRALRRAEDTLASDKKLLSDLEAQVKGTEDAQTIKPVSEEPAIQEKADVSWYNSTHPVEDGKIDDPSQRVIPKISEAEEDIRGANRPDGYGTPEYFNKSSDDYTEEDWKYSARENLKRYEELVAQRNELEKNGWKDDIGRNFTEREAIVDKDGNVVGYGASGAENLDLNISTAYNNYQNALSHFRGGEEPITAIADTPTAIDGHEYRTKNVSDGYVKFIKDNLSDRRSNMEPVDKATNIAVEQMVVTPGGFADDINPTIRAGQKIDPEQIAKELDVELLANNYYVGGAEAADDFGGENVYRLANELTGSKYEPGVDYGSAELKKAEDAIRGKIKENLEKTINDFGNKTLDNDVTLYRVVSSGNEVNKGGTKFLEKDSGTLKNSGISYMTLDEDAVLNDPKLSGDGKKYILRINIPKGENISAFDRSVVTQLDSGMLGESGKIISSGHRAGGEFAANLDGYKFKHTGEFNKDGIEILDVYKESGNVDSDGQTTAIVDAYDEEAKFSAFRSKDVSAPSKKDGYKFVEDNTPIEGIKNENGSLTRWLAGSSDESDFENRIAQVPKEIRDIANNDSNFKRLVENYQEDVAYKRVGTDYPYSADRIDMSYANYLNAEKQASAPARETRINNELAAERQKLADLEARKAAVEKIEKAGNPNTEAGQKAREKATVDVVADTAKNTAEKAQDNFNKAADKSNVAREISESSKYRNRASAQANQNPIGVNYMPGNPFRGFGRWINDDFMRSQSVQINVNGKVYSAYSGGYSLFKEAPSWARMAIIDIRNGATLETAIRNVLSQNGVKIEPTDYARKKYNAPTSMEKDAEKASRIAKKITESALYSKAVKNGIVVDTELLGSMLTKELRRQGAAEFTRFLKKSKFDSFSNPQQKWLNSQAYKMIASFDPKTYKGIKANIRKAMGIVMGAKYRSNMYGNFKNAQLQLTECQRLYTLNKLGDFNKTIRRLVTDQAFRDKIADAAYIYASDSLGQGLSKQDLSLFNQTLESFMKTADASTITAKGILTKLSEGAKKGTKAAIDGVDADLLSATQAAEYFKNYMLLAGIVQSAETKGLTGDAANAYIRNRFNVEALAGTEIGHIGLTESSIGRLAFMYMGFPIRELALQAHIIKGGGITGGTTKLDKVAGGLLYAEKMLGAKGLVWALEAPWGYKFADVMGYDPFGVTDDRDKTADNKNVDPWMRGADIAVQYMPFMRGAISSAFVDIYMAYRESYEDAKDEWLETHDSLEGFEWHLDDAPQDTIWQDALKGFTPGYTAFSRAAQEAGDLDRGYGISSTGNRMYETNTDPGSVAWGMLVGRSNTPNAQDYYQTANPIRDVQRYGLPGLGRSVERALPFRLNRSEGAQMGWRNFREFDPIDANSYSDWFDGSYADEQNWNTGYYAFREEAEEIRDAANAGLTQSNAVEKLASRESQLADLRNRVERYVQAYIAKHPEGISNYKMQQIQRIFNMEVPDAGTSFDRVLGDYSDYEKNYAENRVAQGNFPAPYGLNTPYRTQDGSVAGDYSYAQSPQLRNILQTNQYGVQSDVGRVIAQLDDQLVATPYGSMSLKDFRKKIQADINNEYAQSKVNYDKISDLQGQYLDVFDRSIRPIFNTYGSGILNAGQASDVMQQFTSMLNGLIPSEEYRVDKKGRKIRQSTPYMRVDIKKWLQKNYGNYPAVSTTDNSSEERLQGIRNDMDAGRTAVARAKALAFVEDLREGRTSIDRARLEELQNILRGTTGSGVTGGGNLNTGLTR